MSLDLALQKGQALMDEIDAKMNGIIVPGQLRARVFFGLSHLSLEHFGSIVLLSRSGMAASAAALLRPQHEAAMRAIYFHECAEDIELESFSRGKDPVSTGVMLRRIEAKVNASSTSLLNFYQNTKRLMHGFTHGGYEQLSRRFSGEELKNCFTDVEIEKLINSAQVVACLAASCCSAIAGRDELAKEIIGKYGKISVST